MSVDILDNGSGGLVVVVPITTTGYGLRSHVAVDAEGSGLDHTSYARCDQLRVVSVAQPSYRQGMVAPDQLPAQGSPKRTNVETIRLRLLQVRGCATHAGAR